MLIFFSKKSLNFPTFLRFFSQCSIYRAQEDAASSGAQFIHPFNNENVVIGQATIGFEILEDLPDVEVVLVPIGGGGLATGAAMAIKKTHPNVKVYGVQVIFYSIYFLL